MSSMTRPFHALILARGGCSCERHRPWLHGGVAVPQAGAAPLAASAPRRATVPPGAERAPATGRAMQHRCEILAGNRSRRQGSGPAQPRIGRSAGRLLPATRFAEAGPAAADQVRPPPRRQVPR